MTESLFPNAVPQDPRALYLDLMKRVLLNHIYSDCEKGMLSGTDLGVGDRTEGKRDWPSMAHTMIGLRRLENVQHCVETMLREQIPGDLVETGVWRGGATIMMRAALQAYGVTDRTVWVCDSFEGLPPPDAEKYPADRGLFLNRFTQLAVSLEQVQANFTKYGLLDNQVRFLKGWFRDTLPTAPIGQIAVLRVDGDLYESTMDALVSLYPKVSVGGVIVVDDYKDIAACRQAVNDYRQAQGIQDPIQEIDWTGVYWRRSR